MAITGYTWEITLADDSVKKEADGDKFDLAWEADNAVKQIKMVAIGGSEEYVLTFSDGVFRKDGNTINIGLGTPKNLIYRRRSRVRIDETGALPTGTTFIIGFTNTNGEWVQLHISPNYELGQGTSPTGFTYSFASSV